MIISDKFPKYTKYNPIVPIYCVTPNEGRVIHRFFDTSPFSPTGKYMALFRFPFEDREPKPGDEGEIVIVDLENGVEKVVAHSSGFEHQLGANINWGESDEIILYNDVDTITWDYYGIKLNWVTGEKERLEVGVYSASPDGRECCTGNPSCKWRTQSGYGVLIPKEHTKTITLLSEEEGLFITDTTTGKAKLLLSMKEIFTSCFTEEYIEHKKQGECYVFHSKYSPSGEKIMFSTRWIPESLHDKENNNGHPDIRYNVFTCNKDGSNLQLAIGEEHWLNGGHHTTWHPDEKHLTMNIRKDWGMLKFAYATLDGTEVKPLLDNVWGSGHPTVHPSGKFLITDEYSNGKLSYGDGTSPLRLVYLDTGKEEVLGRVKNYSPYQDSSISLRVDPHPAWDRTYRYIAFNAYEGDTRRVYVVDLSAYVD